MADVNHFTQFLRQELEANRLLLPSLPSVVQKIREAVNDERHGSYQLAKLIQMDPNLTARILQIANSPAYRPRQAIDSCQIAISHLGLAATRDLVTCFVLHNAFKATNHTLEQEFTKLWKHSCHVASICYVLAKINPGFQPDKALLAGLIHDIGVLPILHYAEEFPEIIADKDRLHDVIKQLRGWLGKAILQHWHFAENLIDIPEQAENWSRLGKAKPDYADLVIVAQIHSYFGTAEEEHHPSLLEVPAFKKLSLGQMGPESSLELLLEARDEIESVRRLLHS